MWIHRDHETPKNALDLSHLEPSSVSCVPACVVIPDEEARLKVAVKAGESGRDSFPEKSSRQKVGNGSLDVCI